MLEKSEISFRFSVIFIIQIFSCFKHGGGVAVATQYKPIPSTRKVKDVVLLVIIGFCWFLLVFIG